MLVSCSLQLCHEADASYLCQKVLNSVSVSFCVQIRLGILVTFPYSFLYVRVQSLPEIERVEDTLQVDYHFSQWRGAIFDEKSFSLDVNL